MKRTWKVRTGAGTARRGTALAVAAAAALVLAACGSSAGTAQSSTPPQTQSSSSAPTESTTSAAEAGTTDSGTGGASTEPSGSSASSTVTLSGDLDAQSTTWFNAVCTGLTPMVQQVFSVMGAAMGAAMGSSTDDPAQTQQQLVGALNSMSSSLSDAAKSIGSVPPPTVSNGGELATKLVDALKTAAPKIKQAADQLGATTITTAAQLQQALSSIDSVMESSMDGLSLDEYQLDPTIEDAMKTLPACAPLYSFEQSAAPTS